MSNMKTVGVFVVIFCCFAILYPKIFHPMVVHVFGLSSSKAKGASNAELPRHPKETSPHKPMATPPRVPTGALPGGVHPGMRVAAEMRKQSGDQGGGGKGMIGMVLPMYAVGIVIYLVYTMGKVFMRNKAPDEPGAKGEFNYGTSTGYQEESGSYFNYPTEMDEETRFLLSKREKLEELERLLAKADMKKITDNELVKLKERLEETESQMSRILKAMEHVQNKVMDGLDPHQTDKQDEMDPTADVDPNLDDENKRHVDSSPDMESFEIVGKKLAAAAVKSTDDDVTDKDLNALDSESSGRESDDEESEEDYENEYALESEHRDERVTLAPTRYVSEPEDDDADSDDEVSEDVIETIGASQLSDSGELKDCGLRFRKPVQS